jgi:hypothetical protein
LYSTATYQQGDLSRMGLRSNDLTGWSFAGKNLTGVSFKYSTLTERGRDERGVFGGFCASWVRFSRKIPSKSLIA